MAMSSGADSDCGKAGHSEDGAFAPEAKPGAAAALLLIMPCPQEKPAWTRQATIGIALPPVKVRSRLLCCLDSQVLYSARC